MFGSRANGTSRPDSDVDIAIVLTVFDAASTFFILGEQWQNQLRAATGVPVNIDNLKGAQTPNVAAAVKKHGIKLYGSVREKLSASVIAQPQRK